MYNYFMLIGYVVKDAELREVGEGKRVISLRLAVKREFQNMNGEYDADFINVSLWDFLADNCVDSLRRGSKVGVKGRIATSKKTIGETNVYTNELVVDRLIFLGEAGTTKEYEAKTKAAKE